MLKKDSTWFWRKDAYTLPICISKSCIWPVDWNLSCSDLYSTLISFFQRVPIGVFQFLFGPALLGQTSLCSQLHLWDVIYFVPDPDLLEPQETWALEDDAVDGWDFWLTSQACSLAPYFPPDFSAPSQVVCGLSFIKQYQFNSSQRIVSCN